MNNLIDNLLTPRLASFRQVCFYDEQATLDSNYLTWRTNFGNWLPDAPIKFRKNGSPTTSVSNIDYVYGTFRAGTPEVTLDNRPVDVLEVSYMWDYFPVKILEGFYIAAVSMVNMTAAGPPTSYTVETMPTAWGGVVTDLVFAQCMEKLLLDYDLWKYRLVFAIGPSDVYGSGGSDIVGQLETLKQNAEQRAEKAMDNPKFKSGNYQSPPTGAYYTSIYGVGGGMPFLTGRLRGWKPNRWY